MRRYNRIIEIVWFAFGVITLVLSIQVIYTDGWDENKLFLLAPIISFLMFFMRRVIRKKFESEDSVLSPNNTGQRKSKTEKKKG